LRSEKRKGRLSSEHRKVFQDCSNSRRNFSRKCRRGKVQQMGKAHGTPRPMLFMARHSEYGTTVKRKGKNSFVSANAKEHKKDWSPGFKTLGQHERGMGGHDNTLKYCKLKKVSSCDAIEGGRGENTRLYC